MKKDGDEEAEDRGRAVENAKNGAMLTLPTLPVTAFNVHAESPAPIAWIGWICLSTDAVGAARCI
jgi:hypothetical protein